MSFIPLSGEHQQAGANIKANAQSLFSAKHEQAESIDKEKDERYSQIGRLKVENHGLKKLPNEQSSIGHYKQK